jgi:ATP-dependent helicase HrpB
MSATLETAGLADFLAPAVTLEAGGRTYPVEVFYRPEKTPTHDRRGGPPREIPIWERMVGVCREAMSMTDAGNILMFLPGTHEIRKTIELLEQGSTTRGWEVFPLYSTLPPAAQEAAIRPSDKPKIIVATNVAETSLTIDGVRTVIDSGLARIAAGEKNLTRRRRATRGSRRTHRFGSRIPPVERGRSRAPRGIRIARSSSRRSRRSSAHAQIRGRA